jgi:2'-5' RNA ligase
MAASGLKQSALGVLVPEAEALVKPFRDRYDPSAAEGVPAHITTLVPFKRPETISAEVLDTLQHLFARFARFTFSLTEVRRFPDVLYLAPMPDTPFKALTQAVTDHFPDTPPYGGAFAEVIPHLTLAQVADAAQLNQIAQDFEQASRGRLPIAATVTEVVLLDNMTGRWQSRAHFALSSHQVSTNEAI